MVVYAKSSGSHLGTSVEPAESQNFVSGMKICFPGALKSTIKPVIAVWNEIKLWSGYFGCPLRGDGKPMPRMGTLATLNECAYNPIRVTFLEEALESGPTN